MDFGYSEKTNAPGAGDVSLSSSLCQISKGWINITDCSTLPPGLANHITDINARLSFKTQPMVSTPQLINPTCPVHSCTLRRQVINDNDQGGVNKPIDLEEEAVEISDDDDDVVLLEVSTTSVEASTATAPVSGTTATTFARVLARAAPSAASAGVPAGANVIGQQGKCVSSMAKSTQVGMKVNTGFEGSLLPTASTVTSLANVLPVAIESSESLNRPSYVVVRTSASEEPVQANPVLDLTEDPVPSSAKSVPVAIVRATQTCGVGRPSVKVSSVSKGAKGTEVSDAAAAATGDDDYGSPPQLSLPPRCTSLLSIASPPKLKLMSSLPSYNMKGQTMKSSRSTSALPAVNSSIATSQELIKQQAPATLSEAITVQKNGNCAIPQNQVHLGQFVVPIVGPKLGQVQNSCQPLPQLQAVCTSQTSASRSKPVLVSLASTSWVPFPIATSTGATALQPPIRSLQSAIQRGALTSDNLRFSRTPSPIIYRKLPASSQPPNTNQSLLLIQKVTGRNQDVHKLGAIQSPAAPVGGHVIFNTEAGVPVLTDMVVPCPVQTSANVATTSDQPSAVTKASAPGKVPPACNVPPAMVPSIATLMAPSMATSLPVMTIATPAMTVAAFTKMASTMTVAASANMVAAPAPTIAAPATTIAAPAMTVAAPATTIAAPAMTVPQPATTVAAPSVTVAAHATTIAAPAMNVAAPATTVAAPAMTVAAPATTIAAPAMTVAAPATTTEAPAMTVAAPATTTAEPAMTVAPYATTIAAPAMTVASCATTIAAPAMSISTTAATKAAPGMIVSAPAVTVAAPAMNISAPVTTIAAPALIVAGPATTIAAPANARTEPSAVMPPSETSMAPPAGQLQASPVASVVPPAGQLQASPVATVAPPAGQLQADPVTSVDPPAGQLQASPVASMAPPAGQLVTTPDRCPPNWSEQSTVAVVQTIEQVIENNCSQQEVQHWLPNLQEPLQQTIASQLYPKFVTQVPAKKSQPARMEMSEKSIKSAEDKALKTKLSELWHFVAECYVCALRFESDGEAMRHLKTHPGFKLKCMLCNKKLGSHVGLASHFRQVHGKLFFCKSCKQYFRGTKNMEQHVLNGKCTGTNQIFAEWPLNELYPTCGEMMKLMTLVEECYVCGLEFVPGTPLNLSTHLQTHHESLVTCFLCDAKETSIICMKTHYESIHDPLYRCRFCRKAVRGNDVAAHVSDEDCVGAREVRASVGMEALSQTGHYSNFVVQDGPQPQEVRSDQLGVSGQSKLMAELVVPGQINNKKEIDQDVGHESVGIPKNMVVGASSSSVLDVAKPDSSIDGFEAPMGSKPLLPIKTEKMENDLQPKNEDDVIIESYTPSKKRQMNWVKLGSFSPTVGIKGPCAPESSSPPFHLAISNVRTLSPVARVEIDNAEVTDDMAGELVTCRICSAAFTRRDKMLEHIKVNHEDCGIEPSGSMVRKSVVLCHLCGIPYAEDSQVNKHLKEVHNVDPSMIEDGPQRVEMSDSMNKFLATYAKKLEVYECNLCGNNFLTIESLKKHIRDHGKGKLRCDCCGRFFSEVKGLIRHRIVIHGRSDMGDTSLDKSLPSVELNEYSYECSSCFKTFNETGALKRHRTIKHGIWDSDDKLLDCAVQSESPEKPSSTSTKGRAAGIPDKSFRSKRKSRSQTNTGVQVKEDNGERPRVKGFKCDVCGKGFKRLSYMRNHRLLAHTGHQLKNAPLKLEQGAAAKVFDCKDCSKKYKRLGDLTCHRRWKHGSHVCKVCKINFTGGEWFTHLAMHRHGRKIGKLEKKHQPSQEATIEVSHVDGSMGKASRETGQKKQKAYTADSIASTGVFADGYVEGSTEHGSEKTETFDTMKCKLCENQFFTHWSLDRHMRMTHSEANTHTSKFLSSKVRKDNHKKGRHRPLQNFGCNECGQSFKKLRLVEDHKKLCPNKETAKEMMLSQGVNRPTCDVCGKKFVKYTGLLRHQRMGHDNVTCKVCKKLFKRKAHLDRHIEKTRCGRKWPSGGKYSCSACAKDFRKKSILRLHEMSVHGHKTPEVVPLSVKVQAASEPKVCRALRRKASFECPCGVKFATWFKLRSHESRKHGQKGIFPECPECQKIFSRQTLVYRHVRELHKLKNPFICLVCHKAFAQVGLLHYHVQTNHIDVQARICSINNCGAVLRDPTTYKRHMKWHESEPNYRCLNCGKGYKIKENYLKHMERIAKFKRTLAKKATSAVNAGVTEKKKAKKCYSCGRCSERFSSAWLLDAHQVSHLKCSVILSFEWQTVDTTGEIIDLYA